MYDTENKNNKNTFFVPFYSNGLKTQRDAWCYNFSTERLAENMKKTIVFYQSETNRWQNRTTSENFDDFISNNTTKISWSDNLKRSVKNNEIQQFDSQCIIESVYRPFSKQYLYFNRSWNERFYQQPKLFPTENHKNLCICMSGVGYRKNFSVIISKNLPDLEIIEKSQCFPLYWYEKVEHIQRGFFDTQDSDYVRHDGITDFILDQARQIDFKITKEDIFYYVYGFLHCPEYRETFAADLKKNSSADSADRKSCGFLGVQQSRT